MVIASHWVGLTLPGMIEEPGSFSGKESSPRPHRGPEAKNLMSLAICKEYVITVTFCTEQQQSCRIRIYSTFIMEQAITFKAPDISTMASWEAKASNLLGAVTKGKPTILHSINFLA